jgi:excisionase family DNA binding protein
MELVMQEPRPDREPRLLLSYPEAARALGVSERTLRSQVYRGTLPAVKIGSRRLIALADLERFVAALRETARP